MMRIINEGIVTMDEWVSTPFGDSLRIWAKEWRIMTDNQLGNTLDGLQLEQGRLKTPEGYYLVALGENGRVLAMIPGYHVNGFIGCNETQAKSQATILKEEK